MMSSKRQLLLMVAASVPAMAFEPPNQERPSPPRPPLAESGSSNRAVAPDASRAAPAAEAQQAPAAEARPYFGVILDPVPELLAKHLGLRPGEGVVVGELVDQGPAQKSGLMVDDVVLTVDGRAVGSAEQVRDAVAQRAVGDEVALGLIHEGQRKDLRVVLGAAPDSLPGFGQPDAPLQGNNFQMPGRDRRWDGVPDRHADMIREAMERNRRAFESLRGEARSGGALDLMRRMQEGMLGFGSGSAFDVGFQAESTVRLMDDEGSVEMRTRDGKKEAKVFGSKGDLIWEGPYETEEDKAAAPEEVRERLDRLDSGMSFRQGGFHFKMGAPRFGDVDELQGNGLPPGTR